MLPSYILRLYNQSCHVIFLVIFQNPYISKIKQTLYKEVGLCCRCQHSGWSCSQRALLTGPKMRFSTRLVVGSFSICFKACSHDICIHSSMRNAVDTFHWLKTSRTRFDFCTNERIFLVGVSVKDEDALKFLYENSEDFTPLPTFCIVPSQATMFEGGLFSKIRGWTPDFSKVCDLIIWTFIRYFI